MKKNVSHIPAAKPDFGSLLVERGRLTQEEVSQFSAEADRMNISLDQILLRSGRLDESDLLELLSEHSGYPVLRIAQDRVLKDAVDAVPARTVSRYRVVPIRLDAGVLTLATDRLRSEADTDYLRVLLGYEIAWVLSTRREIEESIKFFYGVGIDRYLNLPEKPGQSGRDVSTQPDIPAFIHAILVDAVRSNATDIHVEPTADGGFRLRYRIDGVLYPIPVPQGIGDYRRAVVSRLKILAQLNIAERRMPQDGRFEFDSGPDPLDVRVSVLPSRHGEAIDLRILNRKATFIALDDLGLESHREQIEDLLALPSGTILFTGPTGSGKSTSLYAALDKLNTDERKIITIEDPVEYQIPGILQLQIQSEIGFTFASGLRSVLRHDPDVVLVGEIRDSETAQIAASAAMTGHLVFSTLHTSDSASAMTRLMDMGLEPYLVASSVTGIVAQRLLRCVCSACSEEKPLDPGFEPEIERLLPPGATPPRVRAGRGCPFCRFTGYQGRQAIFEILEVTDALRAGVIERVPSGVLMREAVDNGLSTLRESGWRLVLKGITSVDELVRVTRKPREGRL